MNKTDKMDQVDQTKTTNMVKALNPVENRLTHPSLWDGLVAIWMPTSYGMLEVRPKAGSIRVIPAGAGLKLLVHKVS